MKTVLSKPFASLMLALAAIALIVMSGPSQAAPFANAYTSADNIVFQVETAYTLDKGDGVILVGHESGTTQGFQDPTGAIWAKVQTSPYVLANFIRLPGKTKLVNARRYISVYCFPGSGTFIARYNLGGESYADGCQLHALIKASSN